jgi:hypothetical protein
MSAILIIRVRIDRLANARRAIPQRSRLGAPAAKSLRKAFSADCITSIGMRHSGRYFYALQPQKIGEPFGDVFFQDTAITVAKAVAHRNQSLSSKFFCITSLGAVHHPDPRGRSGMSEKAQT